MTLKEKIALCEGQNFWMTKEAGELPAAFLCDGPHGLRKQEVREGEETDMLGINRSVASTCFPTAVTSGATWDTDLIQKVGEAIGEEARELGVDLVLGPGANIKRNPLCGRNFEYFSEDPVVSGKMAAAMIRGIQKNGTGACLKHFACNNQEESRFSSDSVLDERTLREIYLTGFEMAVREGKPVSVMSSYNKINGIHSSDSKELLTGILRNEWGFDGLIVTDWGGMNDRIEGFKAGCDLNMPGGSNYMVSDCLKAVQNGTLSEAEINDCARRVLSFMEHAADTRNNKGECDWNAHDNLARQVAEEGAVLLKNNGILPLREGQKIALIGLMADSPRYQGAGSSHINPIKMISPRQAMPEALYAAGCDNQGNTTQDLLKEAEAVARQAEVAVVFAGLPDRYESEGFDRENMQMPEGHIRMIEAVSGVNPNTVVVLCCGGVVECFWEEKVSAILYMGLGGQTMGEACANLLYGKVNPSGKLTESWPYNYEDCICSSYYGTKDALYKEGIYVGYRYYEKAGIDVRWPFGYGLSYTTFAYSDLKTENRKVSVTVRNTGKVAGAETVMLYILPPENSGYRPNRELKDFKKVYLQPEQSVTVTFAVTDRTFAVWDDGWKIPEGIYTVQIGNQNCELPVEGQKCNLHRNDWYDCVKGIPSKEEWERLLGRTYQSSALKKGSFTMDNTVMEMKEYSLIMKIMYVAVKTVIGKGFPKKQRNTNNPEYKMLLYASAGSTLRCMQISGGIKDGIMQGLLDMANGHVLRGLGKMMRG
ncbi:MAG: beta-glucosidase [Erysipelotrichaceae bacterium]|nr:beta-glucosidase [Erysipelotrichaceae bacterium]